jgi:hypothetical protein
LRMDSTMRRPQFSRSVARQILPRVPSRLMRTEFLLPRLAAVIASSKYAASSTWFSPLVLYLHQLETLSKRL